MEENARLRDRLQAAADGPLPPPSSAEQDYEEVIGLLEAEIRDLKNQLTDKRPPPRPLDPAAPQVRRLGAHCTRTAATHL